MRAGWLGTCGDVSEFDDREMQSRRKGGKMRAENYVWNAVCACERGVCVVVWCKDANGGRRKPSP